MTALTDTRLNRLIAECRTKCAALDPSEVLKLDAAMAIDFEEHYEFQRLQVKYRTLEVMTNGAAQIVYMALGENHSRSNGGWAQGTDTATKCIITQLMGQLLTMSIAEARGMST